jgi:hypothetical protein
VQSVPITTKVGSSNPVLGEVYSIQHYVIEFVSDLRQVSGFLRAISLIKIVVWNFSKMFGSPYFFLLTSNAILLKGTAICLESDCYLSYVSRFLSTIA